MKAAVVVANEDVTLSGSGRAAGGPGTCKSKGQSLWYLRI